MKRKIPTQDKELLDIIYRIVTKKGRDVEIKGLVDGKAGIALFLYKYAAFMDDENVSELANILVEELWDSSLGSIISSNFISGKSGFIWFFQELMNMKLVRANEQIDKVLCNFDRSIMQQRLLNPVAIDMQSDLFAWGLSLLKRYKAYETYQDNFDEQDKYLYKLILQEQIIYHVDECERMLHGKTLFNDVLNPRWSLRFLASIYFFLLSAHECNIYPQKTEQLLPYILIIADGLLPHTGASDVADVIAFENLVSKSKPYLKTDLYWHVSNAGVLNINTAKLNPEELLDLLAEAGLYSLIYENGSIFSCVFDFLDNRKKLLSELLTEYLKKNREKELKLSLDGLSALGYGIMSMSK